MHSYYGIKEINEDYERYVLNEEKIYSGEKIGIGIFPGENRNFLQDPYIKVYNSANYEKATKLVRIGIFNVRYIKHRDDKQYWKLNNKQLKYITKIMETPDDNGETYWIKTLKFIGIYGTNDPLYFKSLFDNVPDFTEANRRG